MADWSTYHIRWMIRRDMPQVLEIERDSFDRPWEEDDFVERLRQRNCIGMVAEQGDRLVGFAIYELHRDWIEVTNLAVRPSDRRRGCGRAIVQKFASKLSSQRRSRVSCDVADYNLQAHLFLRGCGFRATAILPDHWGEEDGYERSIDAYRFELRHDSAIGSTPRESP